MCDSNFKHGDVVKSVQVIFPRGSHFDVYIQDLNCLSMEDLMKINENSPLKLNDKFRTIKSLCDIPCRVNGEHQTFAVMYTSGDNLIVDVDTNEMYDEEGDSVRMFSIMKWLTDMSVFKSAPCEYHAGACLNVYNGSFYLDEMVENLYKYTMKYQKEKSNA